MVVLPLPYCRVLLVQHFNMVTIPEFSMPLKNSSPNGLADAMKLKWKISTYQMTKKMLLLTFQIVKWDTVKSWSFGHGLCHPTVLEVSLEDQPLEFYLHDWEGWYHLSYRHWLPKKKNFTFVKTLSVKNIKYIHIDNTLETILVLTFVIEFWIRRQLWLD